MSSYPAKEAISCLEHEIIEAIESTEQGKIAREQANMSGVSHISAVVAVGEDVPSSDGTVRFRAYVELQDDEEHEYEAEIRGICEKLPGNRVGWRAAKLDVLDVGPLPKGG